MKLYQKSKNFFSKTKEYLLGHRKTSFLIICILIFIGAWIKSSYFSSSTITYDLAKVDRGSIITSISATGQVVASNQVDINAKTSGTVLYLNAISGQAVKEGTQIAQVDPGTSGFDLQNAQLAYQQALADNTNSVTKSGDTLIQAQNTYDNSYIDAISTVTSSSNEIVSNMDSLNNLFNNSGYIDIQSHYFSEQAKEQIKKAEDEYVVANRNLKIFTNKIQTLSTKSSKSDIESALKDSYDLASQISQVAKDTQNAVIYVRDRDTKNNAQADSAYSSIVSIVSKANSTVTSINSARNTISSSKLALADAQNTIDSIKSGTNQLDVQSKLIALKQKQLAYSDYFIKAPFDGVIATVDAQKGDTVSNGTKIATIVTKKKIAEISLNEVDAAKVKVGQKVQVTFDALPDLTVDGQVVETDLVGTITQGVVSYKIKIELNSDNDQIKSGMTATANIIVDTAENILRVRSSAIKTQGNKSFVQLVNENISSDKLRSITLATKPQQAEVVLGITNDQFTEIIGGVNEGDLYVVKTNNTSTKATTASAPSLFGGGTKTGAGAATGARTGASAGGFPRN